LFKFAWFREKSLHCSSFLGSEKKNLSLFKFAWFREQKSFFYQASLAQGKTSFIIQVCLIHGKKSFIVQACLVPKKNL
jgi:hypothetical protein